MLALDRRGDDYPRTLNLLHGKDPGAAIRVIKPEGDQMRLSGFLGWTGLDRHVSGRDFLARQRVPMWKGRCTRYEVPGYDAAITPLRDNCGSLASQGPKIGARLECKPLGHSRASRLVQAAMATLLGKWLPVLPTCAAMIPYDSVPENLPSNSPRTSQRRMETAQTMHHKIAEIVVCSLIWVAV